MTHCTTARRAPVTTCRTWLKGFGEVHRVGVIAMLLVMVGAASAPAADGPATIALKAARVYTVAGEPIDNGVVLIQDGRITAVGADVEVPEDAEVIEVSSGVITPGLIDAACSVDFEIQQSATQYARAQARMSFWRALAEIKPEDDDGPSAPVIGAEELACPMPPGPAEAVVALAPQREVEQSWAEQVSEVTPHRLVIDALNLFSDDFRQLAQSGVTTVYISPDSANVIGARGAILRTAGQLDQRVVRRADAVKVALGSDPINRGQRNQLPPTYGPTPDFHTRRPMTRMGVEWVFRKALFDTRRAEAGLPTHGADVPPTEAMPVLKELLDGKIPLRIQARMQNDIFSAMRLASEFNLRFTLEEATEAYRCLPQLKAANVPVIFGPLFMDPMGFRARTGEADRPRLNSPRQLADAGIPFALTAQELRDEQGLVRQGMMAVRNGLTPAQALKAMTATPAEMLGLAGEVGTIAPGARADLVIWNTEPFDATSRPLVVLVAGQVVCDKRWD